MTRPLKDQSPKRTGSRLGPPTSPVVGFVSPWNSSGTGVCASGWLVVGAEAAFLTSFSNSAWSLADSRGMGPGPRGRRPFEYALVVIVVVAAREKRVVVENGSVFLSVNVGMSADIVVGMIESESESESMSMRMS